MVAVTGASGFVGSYLVSHLITKGHQIKAFKQANSELKVFNFVAKDIYHITDEQINKQVKWVNIDVLDIHALDEELEGVSTVYHCAAVVSFSPKHAELMNQINIEGTANVVNACLKNKVGKLIYCSSTAAIGKITENKSLVDEECEWSESDNNTLYSESKHWAELEVWRGIEEGLNAVIVNPSIILGAGDWNKGTCRLFTNIAKGQKFYTLGVNGYVGVKDVVNIMVALAESDIHSERFLLVSENISFKSLFDKMSTHLQAPFTSIELKKGIYKWIKPLVYLYSYLSPKVSITPETIAKSLEKTEFSHRKIKQAINYTFQSIEGVIEETSKWYMLQNKKR